jgi:hypothetical protein
VLALLTKQCEPSNHPTPTQKKKKKQIAEGMSSSGGNMGAGPGAQEVGALMRMRKSLFLDSRFSSSLKLSAIGLALVGAALMLASNSVINNSVWSRVGIVDGPVAALPSLFDLRLFSLIEGLFYFGASEIGVATGLCTAFTGYFVLAASMYCLFVPQTRLNSASRGLILGALNIGCKLFLGEKLIVLTMINVFDIEVRVLVCMYVSMYCMMYVCVYVRMYVCMYCMYVCMYVSMYCLCIECMYLCIVYVLNVCMYVCMYVCMWVRKLWLC